ncbi:MAG: CPBP family intramembrane glutamic endopeptidase [Candidatus Hydrogenedentota bacterium]
MENNNQKPPLADATTREAESAHLSPNPPGWPYMTYLEAVLLSVALLLFQLLAALFVAGFLMAIQGLLGRSHQEFVLKQPHVLMVLSVFAVFPLLVWGWWRSGQSMRGAFGLRAFPWATLLAIVPLSIGAALIISEMDNLLRQMMPLQDPYKEIFESLSSSPLVAFFMLAIMAPITEETLFRGVVLRGLLRQHGAWASSFVSALLFGLVHVYPAQIMPAFLLGWLLAWVHLRTGSIWPCMWMHAVVNTLFLVAHMLIPNEIRGLTTPPEAGLFQPLWLDALAVALFGIGVASFIPLTRGVLVRATSKT